MENANGPSLATYVETRFNLLIEAVKTASAAQSGSLGASIEAMKAALAASDSASAAGMAAADLRYQQRFEAQSDALAAAFLSQQTAMQTALKTAQEAVQAALAAADRAVSKAELAADKRFESVNEFRKTLDDQQRTLMPREEANVAYRGFTDRMATLKEQVDALMSERAGIRGGWGYAVGAMGFVIGLVSFVTMLFKLLSP